MIPDNAFDRGGALALLEQVVATLRNEWKAVGKIERFEELKIFLTTAKGEVVHAEVATRMGMDQGALRVAAHRFRKRYRQLPREEIARTLVDRAMVDEEMAELLGTFS